MTLAYSYLRFSSDEQEQGDSVRRQESLRDAWLKRHPEVKLDSHFEDRGKSGYSGKARAGLDRFLHHLDRGDIAPGSFLILENLDRLSRQTTAVALGMLLKIVNAGVKVQTLLPSEVLYDSENVHSLIMAVIEFGRSNSESRTKGARSNESWDEKRKADCPRGATAPWWLKLEGAVYGERRKDFTKARYVVVEERAEAIRKLFEWSATMGTFEVTKRLDAEVPPFGRSKHWARSYVVKLLNDRAVLGEWQPRKGGKPHGDPRPNYFPPIISEAQWYAVHAARKSREKRSGRPAKVRGPSLFSGIARCAVDQCKMHIITRGDRRLLVSANAVHGRNGTWTTFPLDVFNSALLSELKELRAADLFQDPGAGRVAEIQGRLSKAEAALAVATAKFEADPENPMWSGQMDKHFALVQLERERLREAKRDASNPLSATWAEAVELMAQNQPEQLRAALLLTLSTIDCVIVVRGLTRLCACQVRFDGSNQQRSYLIRYTSAVGGAMKREASSAAWSFAGSMPLLDFRQASHVKAALRLLNTTPLASMP